MTNQEPKTETLASCLPDETSCQEKRAGLWRTADRHPSYPATTETVVGLLTDCGYLITAGKLSEWLKAEAIPAPPTRGGKWLWSARHILIVVTHCEAWRRYDVLHPAHVHKASPIEVLNAEATRAGAGSVFNDLERYDLQSLTVMLVQTEDLAVREMIAVALRTKLTLLGVAL
jgi:hypothetical protein